MYSPINEYNALYKLLVYVHTRSKRPVELFHKAGHISYPKLLQVDTSLADSTLKTVDAETGAVIPPDFVPNRFLHFTCDNIDINDNSFYGKSSFHVTQIAGWQRGPEADIGLKDLRPSTNASLKIPEVMDKLPPAAVVTGRLESRAAEGTNKEWSNESNDDNPSAAQDIANDMTFFLKRQDVGIKTGRTHFNQSNCSANPEMTSVGYIPLQTYCSTTWTTPCRTHS